MTDGIFTRDPRTGQTTAITGTHISAEQRAACTALNRRRTRGILEGGQQTPAGEQSSINAWTPAFERKLTEWGVPLIDIARLGIRDEEGFLSPAQPFAQSLPSGAEAAPFLDTEQEVVYKLFDLRKSGALGKKVVLANPEPDKTEIQNRDATLRDTLEKLGLLHAAGAHATEIVGLCESYKYLIAKQPLAQPMVDFESDQASALQAMKAVQFSFSGLRNFGAVTWILDRAWLVADLHERNIMRDAAGQPTIIDALTGTVPPSFEERFPSLANAIEDARHLRQGLPPLTRNRFEEVPDEEL